MNKLMGENHFNKSVMLPWLSITALSSVTSKFSSTMASPADMERFSSGGKNLIACPRTQGALEIKVFELII
jgi:hypothetical protein